MGFFSSTKPSAVQSPTPSSDGGFIAPDRDARAACWEGRDAFFRCLDSHGIIDSVKEDAKSRKACGEELRTFERDCAGSWVTYFKKRRVMEHQRDATMKKLAAEGAINVDQK